VAEAEVSPGVEEISRYDVVNRVIGVVEFCSLFLELFLELFDEGLVFLAVLDGDFDAGSAVGCCPRFRFNVHVDNL